MTAKENVVNDIDNSCQPARKSHFLMFGAVIVLLTIVASVVVVYVNIGNREAALMDALEKQEATVVSSKENTVKLWLEDIEDKGGRVINNDVFKLFVSDARLVDGNISALFAEPDKAPSAQQDNVKDLAAQLPMLSVMLREFTTLSNFVSSRIVNSRKETYISSETGVPPLSFEQGEKVSEVLASGRTAFSSVHPSPVGLIMDAFLPIFPPQEEKSSTKPISVLLISLNVTQKLSDFIERSPTVDDKLSTHFVQYFNGAFQEISPASAKNPLRTLPSAFMSKPGESMHSIPFGERVGIDGDMVYSTGTKVATKTLASVNLWVFQEISYDDARNELTQYTRTAIGIAALVDLVLILVVSGLWWWLVGTEQRAVASRVSTLLGYIEGQKQLLDGINETISDLISLTDDNSVIQYANHAFAQAVGRRANEVIGLDMPALFGFDTAKRLTSSDHQVMMSGEPMVVNEIIYLQSKKHHFQIAKAPLAPVAGRKAQGIVSVYRDITDLVEAQERSQRVVQQTIDALVRTIEEIDPYLAGHSRFMSSLSAMLGHTMNLSESSISTLEAAANLSQIGKMFIPKEILTKPSKLTDEEKLVMEGHAEHSRRVLQHIEFDLPVVETIYEMNERLDGTGYPRGLTEESIGINARILAVANAFTAMIRPRSYRTAMSPQEIITMLKEMNNSYDKHVVAALEELLSTSTGERLLQTMTSI